MIWLFTIPSPSLLPDGQTTPPSRPTTNLSPTASRASTSPDRRRTGGPGQAAESSRRQASWRSRARTTPSCGARAPRPWRRQARAGRRWPSPSASPRAAASSRSSAGSPSPVSSRSPVSALLLPPRPTHVSASICCASATLRCERVVGCWAPSWVAWSGFGA